MSAQGYTNKRRVLAEAALLKVQYPDKAAFTNTASPSINCLQNYQTLVYEDICACAWNGRGVIPIRPNPPVPPPIVCIATYDGGNSFTNANIIYSGEGAFTNSGNILSGEGTGCPNNFITVINYDGGGANTNSTNILSDQV
jgi:hypothetical protein